MTPLPPTLKPARLTVQMPVIAAYAELTNDFNPIHLDPEFAARTPMGGVIAHGTMSIGLIWQALRRTLGTCAFDGAELDIRFIKPVRLQEALVAGGQLRNDEPGVYDVWVRAESDGSDRIVGSVRVASLPTPREP
jgi:3-hydroxybutyryl-CoA dehydratase